MIGYLEGVAKLIGDRHVVVDRSGVGWAVTATFPLADGDAVASVVTTTWREASGPELWLHCDTDARDAFEAICAVRGIGPATAAAILTQLGAGGLAAAVRDNDVDVFKPVRGVGPKVAGRLLADISLPEHLVADEAGTPAVTDELVTSLTGLGFDADEATRAVAAARRAHPDGSDADLLGAALSELTAAA